MKKRTELATLARQRRENWISEKIEMLDHNITVGEESALKDAHLFTKGKILRLNDLLL